MIEHLTHPLLVDEPMARSGLREQVSERVLTAIFEERFVSGQRLIVQRLSEAYGVSPTPVRESLVELAGLGMVELLPNRGAVVKPFGARELGEMSQVRRVLESEAVRCACGNVDSAELKSLHADFRQLQSLPFDEHRDHLARKADNRLHGMIADHCANPRLAGEIRRYLSLFRALRNVSHVRDSSNDYRHSDDVPEHLLIVRALIARKAAAAADAMDRHIRSVEKTLAEVMFPKSKPSRTASGMVRSRATRKQRA
jgi:DNA-binding GntR family transcriptional regulator